jgi:hypothetical protein
MVGVEWKDSSSLGLRERTSRRDPLPSAAGIKCEYDGRGEYSYKWGGSDGGDGWLWR